MKKILPLVFGLLFALNVFSENCRGFNYQAILKSELGGVRAKEEIKVSVQILNGSSVIYSEEHTRTTNENGVFSLKIGCGDPVKGSFEAIDWSVVPITLQTVVNGNLLSESELSAVPYAMYALETEGGAENRNRMEEIEGKLDSLSNTLSGIAQFRKQTLGQKEIKGVSANTGHPGQWDLVTQSHQYAKEDGMLGEVHIELARGGECVFQIGEIDQRNLFLKRSEFVVKEGVAGMNRFDLLARNIPIKKGEYLVFKHFTESVGGKGQWLYSENEHLQGVELWYGEENTPLSRLATPFGGSTCFEWSIVSTESIFSTSEELRAITDEIAEIRGVTDYLVSNLNVVYDRDGNAYKQIVVNGTLQLISMQYKKALVIGNSWTQHGISGEIDWFSDRGMAASVDGLDLVGQLERGLLSKSPDASVFGINAFAFERDLDYDLDQLLNKFLGEEIDCVVIQMGLNIPGTESEERIRVAFERLISFCYRRFPRCSVYVLSMPDAGPKSTAIQIAANNQNATFVSIYDVTLRGNLGQFCLANGDYAWKGLYPLTNSAVAAHPNDAGFTRVVNKILGAMSYDPLPLYKVEITSNVPYTAPTEWCAGGMVTILTYSQIGVEVAGEDGVIAVEEHDLREITWLSQPDEKPMFAYTFCMPERDVKIEIKNSKR